jgi:hypothetical protein
MYSSSENGSSPGNGSHGPAALSGPAEGPDAIGGPAQAGVTTVANTAVTATAIPLILHAPAIFLPLSFQPFRLVFRAFLHGPGETNQQRRHAFCDDEIVT